MAIIQITYLRMESAVLRMLPFASRGWGGQASVFSQSEFAYLIYARLDLATGRTLRKM